MFLAGMNALRYSLTASFPFLIPSLLETFMIRNTLFILLAAALSFGGCAAKQTTDDATSSTSKEQPSEATDSDETAFPDRGARNRQVAGPDYLASLQLLADAPTRSEANRARNDARHPAETLNFFGLKPDMTVIEIGPGGGWYAEIIRPFVVHEGRYIAALDDPEGPRAHYRKGWERLVESQPALFGDAETTIFAPPTHTLADENSIDMVLTFRHAHGWINDARTTEVFEEFFRVLKPGGTLGVVTHRAAAGADHQAAAKKGYVPQDWLIEQAEKAGFELVEASEINANPKDTKDHPNGVWSLPPTLKSDSEEAKSAARAIGESDRMTLRFIKPAQAN